MKRPFLLMLCSLCIFCLGVSSSFAGTFTSFEIRQSSTGNSPDIIDNVNGTTEFIIDEASMKAALGSNDINGLTIGDITSLAITRHDDITRFPAGSGPYVAPYFNLWITDGAGNYAVVANEPSNPAFQSLFVYDSTLNTYTYDLSFSDLSDKTAKIYENNDKSWLPNNGIGLTFADLANFQILAPSVAALTTGWAGLGSGAPRELNTNIAYGVNWVFGDTLSNYVSGGDGYIVSGAKATAGSPVPEPTTIALFGIGLLGLAGVSRKKK